MKLSTKALLVSACCLCLGGGPAVFGQAQPPKKTVTVNSHVQGTVAKVLVKEGDAVKVGQTLMQIDDTIAAAAVKNAETKLALARKELKTAQFCLEESKAQYDRAFKLFPKAATAEEVAVKKFYLDNVALDEKIQKAAVDVAVFEAEKAELWLLAHRIVAPANGKVVKIYYAQGDVVKILSIVKIAVEGN